jgi:hypothetical protein
VKVLAVRPAQPMNSCDICWHTATAGGEAGFYAAAKTLRVLGLPKGLGIGVKFS